MAAYGEISLVKIQLHIISH